MPEMDDQRVGAEPEKQIFAAPVDPVDDPTDQPAGQIAWNRPAQAAVVDPHRRHFLPFYVRRDPATRRFDFRKFGHLRGVEWRLLLGQIYPKMQRGPARRRA